MDRRPELRGALLSRGNSQPDRRIALSASRGSPHWRATGPGDCRKPFRVHGISTEPEPHRRRSQSNFEYSRARSSNTGSCISYSEFVRANDGCENQRLHAAGRTEPAKELVLLLRVLHDDIHNFLAVDLLHPMRDPRGYSDEIAFGKVMTIAP